MCVWMRTSIRARMERGRWTNETFASFREYTSRVLKGLAAACGQLVDVVTGLQANHTCNSSKCDCLEQLERKRHDTDQITKAHQRALQVIQALDDACRCAPRSQRLAMCQLVYEKMNEFHNQRYASLSSRLDATTSKQLWYDRKAELSAAIGNYETAITHIEFAPDYHHMIIQLLMHGLMWKLWSECTIQYGLMAYPAQLPSLVAPHTSTPRAVPQLSPASPATGTLTTTSALYSPMLETAPNPYLVTLR